MKENCCRYQERMQTLEKTIGQMIFNLGACAGAEPVEGGGGGETVALMMLCHIIWDT